MSYRGKDLDLRTGQPARAGSNRSGSRSRQMPLDTTDFDSPAALYVDDAVLACCNHAYDLALAYRAPEVRLEHLLNAMTRTDAAVAVMAAQGIDVTGLRHDTASLIAAEAPIIYAAERPAPRRSQDLADALHTAASTAEARREPVSVDDLLQTLLEMNREQSGLVMLKRNAPGWPQRGAGEAARPEQLPPLLGSAYQLDPRYIQPEVRGAEPPREWTRMPTLPAYYQQPPVQQGYYTSEPGPAAAGSMADVMQNSRLDQLERMIRDRTGDFAHRGADYGGSAAAPADRLAGLERNVEAKFNDIARVWSVLGERLQALEQAVVAGRSDQALPLGLVDKLQSIDDLGQVLSSIGDRLSGLERQIAAKPAAGVAINLQPLVDRLDGIERSLSARTAAPAVNFGPVLERLTSIDTRVTEVSRGASTLGDRIGQFERKLDTGNTAQLSDRLQEIEEAVAAQRSDITALSSSITASVKALDQSIGQSVAAQKTGVERVQALIGERFQGFTSAFERQRNEIASAVTQPVNDRVGKLTGLLDTQRSEAAQAMSVVSEKLGNIDKLMQTFGQRTLDLHAAHGKDLIELHNAFVKLNTNQQTLAVSMDEWRLDNGSEFATIASRLEGIEKSAARPVEMLEALQETVQTLQTTSLKREERKSRFRHWLMGTDDWYGASWEPGQSNSNARAATSSAQPSNGSAKASGSNGSAAKDTIAGKLRLAPNPYTINKD